MNKRIKNFGFLLFPDLEELDLVRPWEIFSLWRDQTGEPENCVTLSVNWTKKLVENWHLFGCEFLLIYKFAGDFI
jgi:hypothetical protein